MKKIHKCYSTYEMFYTQMINMQLLSRVLFLMLSGYCNLKVGILSLFVTIFLEKKKIKKVKKKSILGDFLRI